MDEAYAEGFTIGVRRVLLRQGTMKFGPHARIAARQPAGRAAHVVDADLSSFAVAADKMVRVEAAQPYVAHFESQTAVDVDLDQRVLVYNALLRARHRLPVRSVVILLRPQAKSPSVTGRVLDSHDPT